MVWIENAKGQQEKDGQVLRIRVEQLTVELIVDVRASHL
jgi:hypothetical protein